jgi:hypothetical protein
MYAVVVGDHHSPPSHPGKGPVKSGVVDVDASTKRRDDRGQNLIGCVTGQSRLHRRAAAEYSGARLLKGSKRHHRAVQPHEDLNRDLIGLLQITGQLKMVARGAPGILQGKDLMVVEDAHEFFELPNPYVHAISMAILLHGHEDYERAWHLMRSENAHLAVCSTIKQVWPLAKANTAELEVLVFEHESS